MASIQVVLVVRLVMRLTLSLLARLLLLLLLLLLLARLLWNLTGGDGSGVATVLALVSHVAKSRLVVESRLWVLAAQVLMLRR